MDKKIKQPRIKPIYAYFKNSMRFYDMDNPLVAQIIFLIQIGVVFGGYVFARPYTQQFFIYFEQFNIKLQSQFNSKNFDLSLIASETYTNMVSSFAAIILILLVIKALSFLIGLYYGTYYFYSQVHPDTNILQRSLAFLQKLPKLIFFNILFYAVFFAVGALFMVFSAVVVTIMPFLYILIMALPVVFMVLNTLFIFKDLLIIEFNVGIFRNFKKSFDLTKDGRKNVIINSLWPLCIGWLVSAFAVDVQNPILSLFIAAFVEVIILLISQRLTALMFIEAASLERPGKNLEETAPEA